MKQSNSKLIPVKIGYCGQVLLIQEHQKEACVAHFKSFQDDYRPQGRTEEFMTQSLAHISWMIEQLRSLATIAFLPDRTVAMLLGLSASKMRMFNSTRRDLVRMQANRKPTSGFVRRH